MGAIVCHRARSHQGQAWRWPQERPAFDATCARRREHLRGRCEGKVVPLRLSERRLLTLLMRRSGSALPRTGIEDAQSQSDREMSHNNVEVMVYRLRKALHDFDSRVIIENIRGVGYALRASDTEASSHTKPE